MVKFHYLCVGSASEQRLFIYPVLCLSQHNQPPLSLAHGAAMRSRSGASDENYRDVMLNADSAKIRN